MTLLIEEAKQIRNEHLAEFMSLAHRIVMGESIDAQQVEATCTAAGRKVEEFEDLVRQLEHRQKIRQEIAKLEIVEQEFMTVRAEIEAEERKKNLALSEYVRITHPMFDRMEVLRHSLGRLQTLKGDLIRSSSPLLKQRVREIAQSEQDVVDSIRAVQVRIEEMEIRKASAASDDKVRLQDAIAREQAQLAYWRERADTYKQRREEIEREMADY